MKHRAASSYWSSYNSLPAPIRSLADKSFALLKADPRHPSLRLKRVGRQWSVRIGADYRALGADIDGGILWIWIGSHAQYDRLTN